MKITNAYIRHAADMLTDAAGFVGSAMCEGERDRLAATADRIKAAIAPNIKVAMPRPGDTQWSMLRRLYAANFRTLADLLENPQ